MLQTARQNVGLQPHVNLAAPFVPFGVPRRDRRGAFGASSRKDEGRRSPPSGCISISSVGWRSASAPKDENDGPPGRSGFLPVHRSDVENPRCRSRFPVRRTARREARGSRRSTKARVCTGGAQRPLAPLPAEGRGRNPRKIGGHGPGLPQASVDEGGQALEGERGRGHGPRGGNWRSGLLRRLARRGSASLRRGRGSALGVQRDGQWRGRHSPENVEFRAGNRKNDGAARRRGRPCPESAARRWSPSPRPTTGRFSKSSGLTSRQSTSFMPANVSARLPTVATDWYDRVTLRDAADGVDKVGDTLSPRQGDDENGDRGS